MKVQPNRLDSRSEQEGCMEGEIATPLSQRNRFRRKIVFSQRFAVLKEMAEKGAYRH